jgi:tRNA A58 N-methylase Trm61
MEPLLCIMSNGQQHTLNAPRLRLDVTDDEFNEIYPANIRELSRMHWTPIAVIKAASQFLVTHAGARVLDIGAGAGKFCLAGAAHTNGDFTGAEQRLELVELTNQLAQQYGLSNARSIHANITTLNFRDYQGLYFFNSYYENIDIYNKIDDAVLSNIGLYEKYTLYTIEQFRNVLPGTRLATYCTPMSMVPKSFQMKDSLFGDRLHLWEQG